MPDALESLADAGSFATDADGLVSRDPLAFPGYQDALEALRDQDIDESVVTGPATIDGHPVELGLFNFAFIGGTLGEVAGERLARGLERSAQRGVPFVLHTATGGARMQEGMRALVQMPKLVAARLSLAEAHQPLIAILGNPTTGGVLASVAASADIVLAETGATIGFAGPRVAELATGRPAGRAHTAEAKLESGLVDAIGDLPWLRAHVALLLDLLAAADAPAPETAGITNSAAPRLEGWAAVRAARSPSKPTAPSLLTAMSEVVIELHGDRSGTDDPAVVTAIARIEGRRAVIIAVDRNHSPGPGAYRKARRAVALAERIRLPVVTLVDTRGADPSDDSESHGLAWEIAALTEAMLSTAATTVSIVTGEGGSGGALAFATTDYLGALSDSIFSVIAPEAAAVILWRDSERAEEAAAALRLSAFDLVELGIADDVIPAPSDARQLGRVIAYHLGRLTSAGMDDGDRAAARRRRWREMVDGSQRETGA